MECKGKLGYRDGGVGNVTLWQCEMHKDTEGKKRARKSDVSEQQKSVREDEREGRVKRGRVENGSRVKKGQTTKNLTLTEGKSRGKFHCDLCFHTDSFLC